MQIYDILNELRATYFRLEKEAILEANKDNKILEKVLAVAYNQVVNYGVLEFPEIENPGPRTFKQLSDNVFHLLERLAFRELTGGAAQQAILEEASLLDAEGIQLLRYILKKDLRIGCGLKTIQKIFPDPIFDEFKVMLCQDFDKFQHKLKWPAIAQVKYDAARVIVIVNGESVQYKTRNGKDYQIDNPELNELFVRMRHEYEWDCVFDGELYQIDYRTCKPKSRQESNGIATKLVRGTAGLDEHKAIGITVWDVLPLEYFIKDDGVVPYRERYEHVVSLVKSLKQRNVCSVVQAALSFEVNNIEECIELSDRMIAEGEEGIIVKNPENVYRKKRVTDILKIKEVQEADLRIVGIEPGTGKYEGKVGALICQDASGTLNVSVGTGLTDADRETLNESDIGKVLAVKYNTKIPNSKKDGWTLFLPRFIEIRIDKDEVDNAGDLK